jgi:hypothetical protein
VREKRLRVKSQDSTDGRKSYRIGHLITEKRARGKITEKPVRNSNSKGKITEVRKNEGSKASPKSKILDENHKKGNLISRKHKVGRLKVGEGIASGPGEKEAIAANRKDVRASRKLKLERDDIRDKSGIVAKKKEALRIRKTAKGTEVHRARGTSKVVYEDRCKAVKRTHHYEHVYRDHCNRLCHRIIWPRYCYPVCYNWGTRIIFRYVYPYYHRKYVFVSIGGCWPIGYRYVRYYWYPCHYYYWYGYYPVAREVIGDTYNYYTYNYYYDDDTSITEYGEAADGIKPVDQYTFADVRRKLAQQAKQPKPATLADIYFDAAVKAFEEGDYDKAAERFAKAMELAPEDVILPFAYAQALFAAQKYAEAAQVLRCALEKAAPEQEGVYYPRGLYPDEDTLVEQINLLAEEAEKQPCNSDLQLLLGYQLLGFGEAEKAMEPLNKAAQDTKNAAAATVLLNLAEEIIAGNTENTNE